jgi:hypothetical protein
LPPRLTLNRDPNGNGISRHFATRTRRVDDAWANAKVELFNRLLYWRTSTERYYVDEQARY